MNSKKKIRKQVRAYRNSLSEFARQSAGLAVLDQLKTFSCYQSAKKIAIYLANDGELPMTSITRHIGKRKRSCYLPVIFSYRTRKMHFAIYESSTKITENRYGISEPVLSVKKQMSAMHLDLVLMPLVAFDSKGNRIGMGGGFYDRTFKFLKRRNCWRKPVLIGVAYDFQEVDSLPADDWDIPLNGIVTPTRLIKFKTSA